MIIKEEIDDFAFFGGVLQQLENQITRADYTEPLTEYGDDITEAHQRYFDRQTDPNGTAWEPLAASTVARKGHATILVDTGRLRQSLTELGSPDNLFRVDKRGALFGTNVDYAFWHQRGTKQMPARPMVGMDQESLTAGAERMADHSVNVLKAIN